MYFFDASEECGGNFISGGNYSNNIWSHIGISKDSSNYNIFVNGELISTNSDQIQPIIPNQLIFGNRYSLNFQFFNGSLDDIAIWNRALTPEEVQELYTLDACTFTVYDTSYVTVYDTLTTYETVYDTLYTYETIYDTLTTENIVNVYDTTLVENVITTYDTLTTENVVNVYDTILVENVITTYDTLTTKIS